ncbi:MAG TPA: OmpA family protein [Alphaproteobacteria bacterium]|nr:OmpA family protein [Alphaproteobacteria bacterium]
MSIRGAAFAVACLALAALPRAAAAMDQTHPLPGYYFTFEGGGSFMPTQQISGDNVGANLSMDSGVALLGAIGFRFDDGFRPEIEINYHRNRIDTIDGTHAATSPHTAAFAGMVNLMYDVPYHPFSPRIAPYVGVGVGAAHFDYEEVQPFGDTTLSSSDVEAAFQGIVGVAYNLTNRVALTADYRYFRTSTGRLQTGDDRHVSADFESHTVMVGLQLTLYSTYKGPDQIRNVATGEMAPIMAPAPAAPTPPPTPAVETFTVYFDFDKSSLSDGAKKVIAEAAVAIRQAKTTHIRVVGYTDLSGPEHYNFRLSLRRAAAVKVELEHQGVPAAEIEMVGKGMQDPAVPTPLGVREPRNRRAEIIL